MPSPIAIDLPGQPKNKFLNSKRKLSLRMLARALVTKSHYSRKTKDGGWAKAAL
jgi:hypothetical protein